MGNHCGVRTCGEERNVCMRKSFFFKNMQFLLKQNLSMVEYEGVYFTSAWPSFFFHQNISFCKCGTSCEFHYFAITGFRVMEKVQNRYQSTVLGLTEEKRKICFVV